MATTRSAPRSTGSDARKRAARIVEGLEALYPDAAVALEYDTPFQLLCAVIMSAQTTDVTVNRVTPELWRRFPTPESLASADPADVEDVIRSTGFYRNKARNIIGAARAVVSEHGGEVPRSMAELVALPGVARKSANIVLSSAFGVVEGIAVDTHVLRLASRWGLTDHTDPVKVEADLMSLIDRDHWGSLSLRIQLHGRGVCEARRPACGACSLATLCPSAFKVKGWR